MRDTSVAMWRLEGLWLRRHGSCCVEDRAVRRALGGPGMGSFIPPLFGRRIQFLRESFLQVTEGETLCIFYCLYVSRVRWAVDGRDV